MVINTRWKISFQLLDLCKLQPKTIRRLLLDFATKNVRVRRLAAGCEKNLYLGNHNGYRETLVAKVQQTSECFCIAILAVPWWLARIPTLATNALFWVSTRLHGAASDRDGFPDVQPVSSSGNQASWNLLVPSNILDISLPVHKEQLWRNIMEFFEVVSLVFDLFIVGFHCQVP